MKSRTHEGDPKLMGLGFNVGDDVNLFYIWSSKIGYLALTCLLSLE